MNLTGESLDGTISKPAFDEGRVSGGRINTPKDQMRGDGSLISVLSNDIAEGRVIEFDNEQILADIDRMKEESMISPETYDMIVNRMKE